MENATKALMIAGGLLFSIIVLGLFMLMFTKLREYPIEMEQQKRVEELAMFNREYEAYQQEKLYGTELISVINKVISNNSKYSNNDKVYDINIKFTLKNGINKGKYVVYYPSLTQNQNLRPGQSPILTSDTIELGTLFMANREYSLIDYSDINDRINDVFDIFYKENHDKEGEKIYYTYDERNKNWLKNIPLDGHADNMKRNPEFYYYVYMSGFVNFKRSHFKCTGIRYNIDTGRVDELKFEEI